MVSEGPWQTEYCSKLLIRENLEILSVAYFVAPAILVTQAGAYKLVP